MNAFLDAPRYNLETADVAVTINAGMSRFIFIKAGAFRLNDSESQVTIELSPSEAVELAEALRAAVAATC